MKNLLCIFAAALLGLAPAHAATVTAVCAGGGGAPGSEVVVTVSLDNEQPATALQLDFAGLDAVGTVVEGSAATIGRAAAHSATAGSRADGSATLLLFSTDMAEIAAGSGEVASFRVLLGSDPVAATVSVTAKLINADGNALACDAASFTATVRAPRVTLPQGIAYDYDRVPIRGTYTLNVPVQNSGTEPLSISSIAFSDPEMSVAGLPCTVAPGSTSTLEINYAPTHRGTFDATATFATNASVPTVIHIASRPFAVNELHVGDAAGISDETVTVPLSVNNMDAITGFTFEFELPSQLEYVPGSAHLSGRAADHALSASVIGNKLHLTAYSLTDSPFSDNDGVIATFEVKLCGRYSTPLTPAKAVMSAQIDGTTTDVTSAVYAGYVTVSYPVIDVATGFDMGRTPVTGDASGTLHISNYGSANLRIDRIVHDGIDISHDAVLPVEIEPWQSKAVTFTRTGTEEGTFGGRMQLYTNDPDSRMVHIEVTGERYAPNELTVTPETQTIVGECTVAVGLDNYDAISALQFDLICGSEFTPLQPSAIGRAEGFDVQMRTVSPGKTRYFVYNIDGSDIEPGSGGILRLPFSFDRSLEGSYTFDVSGVKLSDASMADRHSAGDYSSFMQISPDVTGITEPVVEAASGAVYYTPAGVEVPAGTLAPGIYIKVTPTSATKVHVR